MTVVYHYQRNTLHGDYLRPLNDLKQHAPEVYAAQVKKYTGREVLLEQRVPYLDCLWNDVLFFSPVHPRHIRDAYIAVGKTWPGLKWFEVDTVALNFTPENTVFFHSDMSREKGDFSIDKEAFEPFKPDLLANMREMPPHTLDYYKEAAAAGEPIFTWMGITHVMHRGRIAFDDMRSFQC
jgi:hypothetical protein